MVVVLPLQNNLLLKVIEILNQLRVYQLHIFVVGGRQMVIHERDFLSKQVYLFFVLSQVALACLDIVLYALNTLLHVNHFVGVGDGAVHMLTYHVPPVVNQLPIINIRMYVCNLLLTLLTKF